MEKRWPMSETRVMDLFQINGRFLRSVHIERDFYDVSALDGYIETPFIELSFKRILYGLSNNSGQRAWRITGDYGSGKSTFALALAHILSGEDKHLPSQIKKATDFSITGLPNPNLIPILVTGSREAITVSILKSLARTLKDHLKISRRSTLLTQINSIIEVSARSPIPDTQVMEIIEKVISYICKSGKGTGMLIVLDEMGKFLEFAALHPEQQDIYFFQVLAEAAARSGDTPLMVLGLLHQGFNTYADQLSKLSQREWNKVADRYEELIFNQPLEQTAILVAEALNTRKHLLPKDFIEKIMGQMVSVMKLGWFGSVSDKSLMVSNAARLYPLHPTVLPVLSRLFSRFGQNERSLFSFLASNEPYGLATFSDRLFRSDEFYRIHNLYDYIRTNFGHRLNIEGYRSHWGQIEAIVESFSTEDEVALNILKTVAILNLLNVENFPATDATLELALDGNKPRRKRHIRESISKLQKVQHVIYSRGTAGGYCLWPNTSINLEKKYFEATKALEQPRQLAPLLRSHIEAHPLVARRHYIETGNLRHFEVRYISVLELQSNLEVDSNVADGKILMVMCENEEERLEALDFAMSGILEKTSNILIAVPETLSSIKELLQELMRWEWVVQNTPELSQDNYAFEEISRQIAASQRILQKRIRSLVGLKYFDRSSDLQLFYQGKRLNVNNSRGLTAYLSDICDDIFDGAPKIKNELVNRRVLSSAAAAARMRLIERMFKYATAPFLGMSPGKTPPEMSIYLSVLNKTELHKRTSDGFKFVEPDDRNDSCRVLPTLRRIKNLLESNADTRVCISSILKELRKPPFGVRDGLHPIFLASFALIHENDVAFYEDGAFIRHVSSEHFHRMIKAPETFEIQWCRITGVRSAIYEQLTEVLGLNLAKDQNCNVLDVVVPLSSFAAQLPAYTHNTKHLSVHALAVRNALLIAREPVSLIFNDLPRACGFQPFDPHQSQNSREVQQFANILKESLDELRDTYPGLLKRISDAVVKGFDLPCKTLEEKGVLSDVASKVLAVVNEPRLKAFLMRLADSHLEYNQWLESLGSFVCSKPPSKWTDTDVNIFLTELTQLIQQYKNVEAIAFNTIDKNNITAFRMAVTQQDGNEVAQVIFIKPEEEAKATEIENQVEDIIRNNKRVGLAAISRAVLKSLAQFSNEREN